MKIILGLPMFYLSLGVPCEHHLCDIVFGDSGSRLILCFLCLLFLLVWRSAVYLLWSKSLIYFGGWRSGK